MKRFITQLEQHSTVEREKREGLLAKLSLPASIHSNSDSKQIKERVLFNTIEDEKRKKEFGTLASRFRGDAMGRSRKVLGDIGNLIRGVTRSFFDKTLANDALNNKAKEPKSKLKEHIVVDIDAGDIDNELAVVEYVQDMYKFYKRVENETRPHASYMESQPEINEKMRATLVDWLVLVHMKFEFSQETLYLTINIIDRFLAVQTVPWEELQLVGITALLMASKYEEVWAHRVNEFASLSEGEYSHEQILEMERIMLRKLEWNLSVPTPFVFLVRFFKASSVSGPDEAVENMAHFLCELGMMDCATLQYCPSLVAASAVFAARCTLNKNPAWNQTLNLHTGYSEQQLLDCAKLLVSLHCKIGNGNFKYSDPRKGVVAKLPPAKNLVPLEFDDTQLCIAISRD